MNQKILGFKLTSEKIFLLILILVVIYLISQTMKKKEHFQTMSVLEKGKIVESVHKFVPWTLGYEFNVEVNNVLNTILDSMNQKLGTNFKLDKIDNVHREVGLDGEIRYVIDFFTFQFNKNKVNDPNRRFIADISLKENNLRINTMNVSNANTYDHPFKTQLVSFENQDLILKQSNYQNFYHIMGNPYNNTTVEMGKLDGKEISNFLPNRDRDFQSWIVPKDQHNKKVFPCRQTGKWWNEDGVQDTQEPSENCKGINSATVSRHYNENTLAHHTKLPVEPNSYTWLFDRARGTLGSEFASTQGQGSTIVPYWDINK